MNQWELLCRAEPRLVALARRARMVAGTDDWREYSNLKADLERLVGWEAENQWVRTVQAFHVAHDRILELWEGR